MRNNLYVRSQKNKMKTSTASGDAHRINFHQISRSRHNRFDLDIDNFTLQGYSHLRPRSRRGHVTHGKVNFYDPHPLQVRR